MAKELNYGKIDYNTIKAQLIERLQANDEFRAFAESDVAGALIDIIAAKGDLDTYYVSRRAQELASLDTAKLRSSVIALSKQLGYDITRPIPAVTAIRATITTPIPAEYLTGAYLLFEAQSNSFTFDNNPYTPRKSFKLKFTEDLISAIQIADEDNPVILEFISQSQDPIFVDDATTLEETEPAFLIQGELKQQVFALSDNTTVTIEGDNLQAYQRFVVDDESFSNYFGESDINDGSYVDRDGLKDGLTKVVRRGTGDTTPIDEIDSKNYFFIDRSSFFSNNSAINLLQSGSSNVEDSQQICVIRTTRDDKTEIIFGDGEVIDFGLEDNSSELVVEYFSTLGKDANTYGTDGDAIVVNYSEVSYVSPYFGNTSVPPQIRSAVKFEISGNVYGGQSIESQESIRFNAPGRFSTQDRLVSRKDYENYIKSLNQPIDVVNAIAWGEQELEQLFTNGFTDNAFFTQEENRYKLFATIFFSLFGNLYNNTGERYYYKSYDELVDTSLLETVYSTDLSPYLNPSTVNLSYGTLAYFYLFLDPKFQIFKLLQAQYGDANIQDVLSTIYSRSVVGSRQVYLPPTIHYYELTGEVVLRENSADAKVSESIRNEIYKYLETNIDFNVPIKISNLIKLIQNDPTVKFINNISFTPVDEFTIRPTTINSDTITSSENFVEIYSLGGQTSINCIGVDGLLNDGVTQVPEVKYVINVTGRTISSDITFLDNINNKINTLIATMLNVTPDDKSDASFRNYLAGANMIVAEIKQVAQDDISDDECAFLFLDVLYKYLSVAIRNSIIDNDNLNDLNNYSFDGEVPQIRIDTGLVFKTENQ